MSDTGEQVTVRGRRTITTINEGEVVTLARTKQVDRLIEDGYVDLVEVHPGAPTEEAQAKADELTGGPLVDAPLPQTIDDVAEAPAEDPKPAKRAAKATPAGTGG